MSKIVIEVGSHDAKDTLKLHAQFPEAEAIFGFEAHPRWYQISRDKCATVDKIEILNKAIYEQDGEDIKFNECQSGGASSLLDFKSDSELDKIWGKHRQDVHSSGKSFQVSTTRIDTFLTSRGYKPETTEIIYTHVDAQGVDLEALRSFGKFLSCVQAGVLETVNSSEKAIYVNQQTNCLVNVLNFLNSEGFTCDSVRPNDSSNCEVNVYFRKWETNKKKD